MKEPKLTKTRWGFYQYSPLPDREELALYYREKYFQEGRGSYDTSYTPEEVDWFRLRADLYLRMFRRLHPAGESMTMLDAGCGEGWLAQAFHQAGFQVSTIDYSSHGMEKHHPHLLPFHMQGDMDEHLRQMRQEGKTFDFVSLCNVLEHVLDPLEMMRSVRELLNQDGLLLVTVPNDFSRLHDHLMEHGYVTKQWWLAYPDHLSYFNKESMAALVREVGMDVAEVLADHPIDLLLLHDTANYVEHPENGKAAHLFRCRMDNFLGGIDPDKLLAIYQTLGSMGVGRDLNIYCRRKC